MFRLVRVQIKGVQISEGSLYQSISIEDCGPILVSSKYENESVYAYLRGVYYFDDNSII